VANEVVAVVLFGIAALLALSFVTYSSGDASWNTASSTRVPSNLIGLVGAHLSDLFLQLFGFAAYTIPVLLTLVAVRIFFSETEGVPAKKLTGAAMLVIALSGFLSLFPKPGLGVVANLIGNGGAVGYIIESQLAALMNIAGAAIVLTLASVLTLMLTMEVSLAAVSKRLRWERQVRPDPAGRRSLAGRLRAWLATLIERQREASAQRRVARAETRRQKDEERERRRLEEMARLEEERLRREKAAEWEASGPAHSTPPPGIAAIPVESRSRERQPRVDAEPGAPEPRVTPSRPPASAPAAARARLAYSPGTEQSRAAQALAADPSVDPEIAEMVSTASIVRTSLVDGEDSHSAVNERSRKRHSSRTLMSGSNFKLPTIDLLDAPIGHQEQAEDELRDRAAILAEKCKEFSVTGHIHRINPGPVVTTFEFKPDPGIKYSRVVGLADDLCLALKAESIRIDRIPGKSTVGIEVPNAHREKILLREVIESPKFRQSPSMLTIGLGKTINGDEYVADLAKMPHLLIAGATGAGKSVTLNAIICSVLYKATPEDVKFIMVDPKRLELGLYEGIPHLLTPIVTDPKRASNALKWAVGEMEKRYRVLAELGVRNIDQYNRQVREMTHPTLWDDIQDARKPLPFIVIAIDELADLMMVARGEVETSIARLAQMARAVGIHLVLATQRPSVDVITGVIKANFPSRIAFRVSSKVDSRTIIDSNGAEALLGQGDMLFLPPASSRLIRVHGSFVNEAEIKRITDQVRNQAEPDYNDQVTMNEQENEDAGGFAGERDELYDNALAIVTDMGRASTSVLQRRLSIGYGRAAKILDVMEQEGFIGPAEGAKPRKVLRAAHEFRGRLADRMEDGPE
jgi:S-DNA-T family DNA segregation ATPase FtsK/SpoIIIE